MRVGQFTESKTAAVNTPVPRTLKTIIEQIEANNQKLQNVRMRLSSFRGTLNDALHGPMPGLLAGKEPEPMHGVFNLLDYQGSLIADLSAIADELEGHV